MAYIRIEWCNTNIVVSQCADKASILVYYTCFNSSACSLKALICWSLEVNRPPKEQFVLVGDSG